MDFLGALLGIFLWVSLLLNDTLLGMLLSLVFVLSVLYLFKEQKLAPFLLLTVLCALMLGFALKPIMHVDRPCISTPGMIPCPPDFSRPSLHSLLAFTVAILAIGNRSFPVFFGFAAVVAYGRVFLGVHTLGDAGAALALSFFACVIAEMIWKKIGRKLPNELHLHHDTVGLLK